jgi:hypothetical protein
MPCLRSARQASAIALNTCAGIFCVSALGHARTGHTRKESKPCPSNWAAKALTTAITSLRCISCRRTTASAAPEATTHRILRGRAGRAERKALPSLLRSGRADRRRVLALAGRQHRRDGEGVAARCRQSKSRQASRGCAADADGFGDHRLFRSVSAAERPPHRYVFTVFALSQKTLAVTADSSAALVGFNLNFNTLVKATLMACSSAGACVISTASPRWTRTYQHRRSGVSSPTSRTSRQATRCDTA